MSVTVLSTFGVYGRLCVVVLHFLDSFFAISDKCVGRYSPVITANSYSTFTNEIFHITLFFGNMFGTSRTGGYFPYPMPSRKLYNFAPFKAHFYIVKLGFTGVLIIVLISAQKYILRVLVRTAAPGRF